MNSLGNKWLAILVWGLFLSPSLAGAYDFPAAYNKEVNNPSANTKVIDKYLTSSAGSSAEATEDAERSRRLRENIATALYAEAISTRIKVIRESKKKKLPTPPIKESRTILQDEVLKHTGNIARRLNDIVALEAGIADMQGTNILTRLPNEQKEEEE